MITTIIITALVSALTTLMVGYFIWSGISARKLKKQVKDNTQNILGNNEYISNVDKRLDEKEVSIYNNINIDINELKKKLSKIENDLDDKINNNDDEIHRDLDRRFDKVYQILDKTKIK